MDFGLGPGVVVTEQVEFRRKGKDKPSRTSLAYSIFDIQNKMIEKYIEIDIEEIKPLLHIQRSLPEEIKP